MNNIDSLFDFYCLEKDKRRCDGAFKSGYCYVDPVRKCVTVNGDRINLRGRTFDIFLAIAKRKGEFVSHFDLFKEVFPDKSYSKYSSWVSVSIYRLRNILGENVVLNKTRKGFCLNLDYGRRFETKDIPIAKIDGCDGG